MKDEIGCSGELRVRAAAIVGRLIVGVFEAQFRTKLDGASDPFGDAQRIF
jgi:hypothetical protein